METLYDFEPGCLAADCHRAFLNGLRLLPSLFILYIVNYIDRTNLAYAAMGMSRDLGVQRPRVWPGRGSARRMISATMIAWGSLTVLTALVHTPSQLYLARFVRDAAEAGFFPGVMVYLSHWFVFEDRAKATSNFIGRHAAVSGAGITAGGLDSGPGLAGVPGMALAVCGRGSPGDSDGSSCVLFF